MKSILFITFSLLIGLSTNAQCTPDLQYTSPGFYPDSATGLEYALVIYQIPISYSETITYVVPADTTTMIGPLPVTLTIDSVVLIGLTGLPPSLTYSCFDDQNMVSPADGCSFEGGTIGCIGINGIPDFFEEGVYPLSLYFEMYLDGLTSPSETFSINYTLNIIHGDVWPPPPDVNLEENTISRYKLFPNPSSHLLHLTSLEGIDISSISISNAEGKELGSYHDIHSSDYNIDVSNLDSGVYFLRIASDTSSKVERFIKK